jgi:hypothetical protein
VNRRTFDLIVLTVILLRPAEGLVKMAARRWSQESNGAMGTVGDAIQVAL